MNFGFSICTPSKSLLCVIFQMFDSLLGKFRQDKDIHRGDFVNSLAGNGTKKHKSHKNCLSEFSHDF